MQEGEDVKKMDLVGLTNLAERAFTEDLEAMIAETIDTNKIDYAVITGVQVRPRSALLWVVVALLVLLVLQAAP